MGYLTAHVFGFCHPLQWCVICNQCEMSASQVGVKFPNGPFDGKGFLFHGSISSLGGGQLPADVYYRVLLSIKLQ